MIKDEDFLELVKTVEWGGVHTWMSLKDVTVLYEACMRLKPKVIVELGTGNGTSTIFLALVAKKIDGRVFTCDMDNDIHQWGLEHSVDNRLKTLNLLDYVYIFRMHDLDFARIILESTLIRIDLLFVDTTHKYEETKKELLAFLPLLTENGECFLHDVEHGGYKEEMTKAITEALATTKRKFKYEVLNTVVGMGRLY